VVFNATFGGFGGVFELDVTDAVVTRIDIDPPELTIPAGLRKQLKANGTFSDDSTRDVTSSATWSTSDSDICSVSNLAASMGLFSAVKPGPCALAATIAGVSGSASVTVSNAALTKVTITPLQNDLKGLPIGLSQRFVAMGTYTAGNPQDITSQVFWSSSEDSVAGISNKQGANGLAFAIAEGLTVIKAEDAETPLSNTVTLTVPPAVIIKVDVSCDKNAVPEGLTSRCKAMATYSIPGVVIDATNVVSWSSSAPDVATIDSHGLVIAKKIGTTGISATDPDSGVMSNIFAVDVTDAILERIELEQTRLFERFRHRTIGEAPPNLPVEFKARGFFSDKPDIGMDITGSVSWSIQPDSDCQLSLNFATGLKPGKNCDVSATRDGVSATATLVILDVVQNAMEVAPTPASIAKGTALDFHAWGIYNLRDPGKTLGMAFAFELTRLVAWSTHDIDGTSPVAEISNAPGSQGRVSGLHVGRATVQAIDPQSKISGQADLAVTPAELVAISLAPEIATIHLGQWQQFLVTATFTDGTTQDVTDMANCSSPDAAAAPVYGHPCRFSGVAVGEAIITGEFRGDTATAKLTVSEAELLAIKIQTCDRAVDNIGQIINCHDADSAQVMVGQDIVFRALGFYTDTDLLNGGVWDDVTPFVAWDSSGRDVAQVSNDLRDIGSATGLAVGQSTITAIDPGTLVNGRLLLTVVPAIE